MGIHATVIHSILTGRFPRELGRWPTVLWIELALLALLLVAAVRLSTGRFVVVAGAAYAAVVAAAFYRRIVLLLGDATGHGVGPALSVTQVRSMLRLAVRLGADLDTTLRDVRGFARSARQADDVTILLLERT